MNRRTTPYTQRGRQPRELADMPFRAHVVCIASLRAQQLDQTAINCTCTNVTLSTSCAPTSARRTTYMEHLADFAAQLLCLAQALPDLGAGLRAHEIHHHLGAAARTARLLKFHGHRLALKIAERYLKACK